MRIRSSGVARFQCLPDGESVRRWGELYGQILPPDGEFLPYFRVSTSGLGLGKVCEPWHASETWETVVRDGSKSRTGEGRVLGEKCFGA